MKLNYDSYLSRLYRWFYLTDNMPNNLCPYFWKLVIMLILILPTAIISLPIILIETIKKEEFTTYSERFGLSFIAYVLIIALISIGAAACWPWFTYSKNSFLDNCAHLGVMMFVFGFAYGIYSLLKWIFNSISDRITYTTNDEGRKVYRERREPRPNIIVEFIKAKYEKNCPRVEWFNQK